jgi:GT2 family glycosyltransferase
MSTHAQGRPLVSVVMANFNGGPYLAESIGSVRKQSLQDFELIVADDASTDGSAGLIEEMCALDPRIRLLRSDRNSGPAAARNRAIDVARGEWIAVVDSDDRIHPTRLATLVAAATGDRADLVADDLLEFPSDPAGPPRRLLCGQWARGPFWVDIVDYVRLNRLYGAGPALGYLKPLMRRAILHESRIRYDETLKIAEDYNLVLRLLRLGKAMRVYPVPLYYYRKHVGSISHRLSEDALAAIKASDVRFLAQVPPTERRLVTAMEERIESIDSALAYERLLSALKAGQWALAAAIALKRPQAAALLRLPIAVRLRRLVARRGREGVRGRPSPDADPVFGRDHGQERHPSSEAWR